MEKEKQEEKIESPTEVLTMVERAEQAALRMEKANAVTAELLARQEALAARSALGGKSEAGKTEVPVVPESPKEYAKRILSGKQ